MGVHTSGGKRSIPLLQIAGIIGACYFTEGEGEMREGSDVDERDKPGIYGGPATCIQSHRAVFQNNRITYSRHVADTHVRRSGFLLT
jgi:hypothetical protein